MVQMIWEPLLYPNYMCYKFIIMKCIFKGAVTYFFLLSEHQPSLQVYQIEHPCSRLFLLFHSIQGSHQLAAQGLRCGTTP